MRWRFPRCATPPYEHTNPTNGLAESPDLIRVAATRTPGEARPVSGTIIGDPGEAHLSVTVEVRLLDALDEAA